MDLKDTQNASAALPSEVKIVALIRDARNIIDLIGIAANTIERGDFLSPSELCERGRILCGAAGVATEKLNAALDLLPYG